MKKYFALPVVMVSIFMSSFLSCDNDVDPVHVTDSVNVVVPAIVTTLRLNATKDASIYSTLDAEEPQHEDYGSGGSDLLFVGFSDQAQVYSRALVAFDVSSVPAGATIISATLNFTSGKIGVHPPAVFVHKLTENWVEGTTDEGCSYQNNCSYSGAFISDGDDVCWVSRSFGGTDWTTTGGTFSSTASATVAQGDITSSTSAGLVSDVQSWVTSPSTNFGWILKSDEEAIVGTGGEQIRYLSKEATVSGADPATKPSLVILYQQP